ncbi:MAG: phosphoethanolamine transferase [Hydrogenovibrio sp.]|uniref:phosphoethanolamine transferase n=1 Tax=Hydrogenovibrio sp. TaxID=2065821 RepID=UPI00286FE989|nr:phosphoethanolamine transferase [Hydrogenovibrio sp.]MDR9498555.1 phosphoethanolamine transferase [Hydrogenovibrio sp.]MDR9499215.1 phosphoethanolamine transferase [Hydrogenovibrio sp.]
MQHVWRSPWWATFVIFLFPLLVTYAYVDFVRESELNARLGWFVMLAGLTYLLRHTALQKVFLLVLLLMALSGAFDMMYAITFSGIFTSASFQAMAHTDLGEGIEFLWAYASIENIGLLALYLGVSYVALRRIEFRPNRSKKEHFFAFLGVVLVIVALQQLHQRGRAFDTIPGFLGVGIDYARNFEGFESQIDARRTLYESTLFSAQKQSDEPQTYVVVIGESMNRHHLQLYGYPRGTTPNLSERASQMHVFQDGVATFAQTTPSLSVALTQADLTNGLHRSEAISLMGIAKKAGFKTWWISNQQPMRVPTAPMAGLADVSAFISHDYAGVQNRRYDGFMLPYIKQALADPAAHKVIFVHLMGSHLQYSNRYPEDYPHAFEGVEGIQAYRPANELSFIERDYINEYDTSIHYTDKVLGELLDQADKLKEPVAVSFFADHGEEIYDVRDFKGHAPDAVTHNMVDIPFLLWRNDAYRSTFAQTDKKLESMQNQPFFLQDYFHFAQCFMNIDSSLLNFEKSMCEPARYTPSKRMVYGLDYDVKGLP